MSQVRQNRSGFLRNRILSWEAAFGMAVAFFLVAAAEGASTWQASSNFWHTAANWDSGVVPGASTDVLFGPSTYTTITFVDPTVATNPAWQNASARNVDFVGSDCPAYTFERTGMFSLSGNLTIGSDVTTTQKFFSNVSFRLLRNDLQSQIITNNGTGQLIIESGVVSNVTRAIAVFDGRGDIQVGKLLARLSSHNLDIVKQGTGTLTIVGAETVAPGSGWVGYSYGTTTILGGKLAINNEGNLGANPGTVFDADALLLDGGTLKATAAFTIDDSRRGVTVGPAGGTFEVVAADQTLTIANVIAGTGSLSKSGSGTLTLTAANLYSGATHVETGTLALSGSGSTANSSAISVAAGATLDIRGASGGQYALTDGQTLTGDGSVLGNLVVSDGATISAGNSPGKLTITGSCDQNGTMLIDLWGEDQGTAAGYDWIDVAGAASLQGLLMPVLGNGFLPQTGETFRVLTADSITIDGNLQIASSAASLASPQYWKYTIVDIAAGRQALELSVMVPEPATLSLLMVLMPLGLLVGRRLHMTRHPVRNG